MSIAVLTFWVLAMIITGSGLFLAFTRNMIHAALALMLVLMGSAGLFMLSGAEFIALSMIVIYVGGILVLLLFFIFYLGKKSATGEEKPFRKQLPALSLMGVWLVLLVFYLNRLFGLHYFHFSAINKYTPTPALEAEPSNPLLLGRFLFSEYVLEFELIGLLLLIVLVVVGWLSVHVMSKEDQ